ncbi:MAG TPA: hypothetical protein VFU76_08380 [Terriglobales bacterium]|nr:hypothetical protein [Terriglobales bacterium]
MAVLGVALLLCAPRLPAQAHPLEEMPINVGGTLNVGYLGGKSDGGVTNSYYFGGNATVDGYYHDPRFLKFEVSPNYRFDRNGQLELLTHDSNQGVMSRVDLFNATSMPISFTHSFLRVASTNFTGGETPISLAANGTTNDFAVNWAFHRRSLPAFSFNYGWGTTDSTVEGWSGNGVSSSHNTLGATVTYTLLKFRLFGSVTKFDSAQHRPDILNLGYAGSGKSDQRSENFGISRQLPWKSNFDAHFGRNNTTTNYFSTPLDQQYDTAGANLNTTPTRRLLLNFSTNYSSNIAAQLLSQVVTPTSGATIGATLPGLVTATSSGSAIDYNAGASFDASHGFWITGAATHEMAKLSGQTSTSTGFTGSVMYSRFLKGGLLNASYTGGFTDLGLRIGPGTAFTSSSILHGVTAGYARRVGRWNNQGVFRLTNSGADTAIWPVPLVSRTINADVSTSTRLWHKWNVAGGFNLDQAKATMLNRNSSFNKGFHVTMSNRTWTFLVQDQFNSGYSFVSPFGIVPVNLPGVIPALLPQTYYTDSKSLSFAATYTRRRLQITTSYTRVTFDITGARLAGAGNSFLDSRLYYKFRKVDFRAGFRRWTQTTTDLTSLNIGTTSWYFELARTFRLF